MATKSKLIKVLGLAATFIGVAATLVTDWVNEQKMDEKEVIALWLLRVN